MPGDYIIHLNFLPIADDLPDFTIYRKPRPNPQDCKPEGHDVHGYSLPRTPENLEDRASYWVALNSLPGFEEFHAKPSHNNDLTAWTIFQAIATNCIQKLAKEEYWVPERGFQRELHFNMNRHNEGDEQLVVRPYHLSVAKKFGILADFHFRLRDGVKFSRKVQQLSLSLDDHFRRNLDFYVDRFAKINAFLQTRWEVLSPIRLPGADRLVNLSKEFEAQFANRLQSRVYVFGNNRESRSQFTGLKDFSPLEPLKTAPKLLFIFREQDRQAARTLAAALKGSAKRERFSFPGFQQLFKSAITIDSDPVVVPDFSTGSMSLALDRMQKREGPATIPLLVMPDEDDEGYLNHKSIFTHAGIPSQVCTLGVIQDENTLKWSVGNIALQVFCKAGGLPWKVRPASDKCLIIGISQSHKLRKDSDGDTSIEKYFAFSILTDSSGLFQKIQVLGQGEDERSYLDQLRTNLSEVLAEKAQEFPRVVIHTSFKLKHREMDEIQSVVQAAASSSKNSRCRFAVVKVNQRSGFFGANRTVNSLVPFEGTHVRLGRREHLVWFEGIYPDKPTVTKAFPGPTHLHFLRVSEQNDVSDDLLLQDLMNLSGANWRGFNAKSAPVSIFYCHLVADMVHDFQERGLLLPAVEGLRPWFL
jgi:hypothetical protein